MNREPSSRPAISRVIGGAHLLCAVLAICGICLSTSAQTPNPKIPPELSGQWVLRSLYSTPNIWGISLKQAKSLIGSRLRYRDGVLSSCKQHAVIGGVEQRDVSRAQFLAGRNNVRFSDVGIHGASVREIILNGNQGGNCFGTYALPGEDVYMKGPDQLLVDFEGVYFRAIRVAVP
jgi:hypothetical protein